MRAGQLRRSNVCATIDSTPQRTIGTVIALGDGDAAGDGSSGREGGRDHSEMRVRIALIEARRDWSAVGDSVGRDLS